MRRPVVFDVLLPASESPFKDCGSYETFWAFDAEEDRYITDDAAYQDHDDSENHHPDAVVVNEEIKTHVREP